MRILMLRPQIELGGVATHLDLLCRGLLERGHWVGAATAGGNNLQVLQRAGVPIFKSSLYPSTPLNLIRSVVTLTRYVRANQIDTLHSHHRFTTVVGKILSKIVKIPLVVTLHEFKQDWRLLASVWTGSVTITPSQALKSHLTSFYGVANTDIVVVPNAISIVQNDPLHHQERVPTVMSSSRIPTVGYIGRLSPEKGVQYFVESMPLIKQCAPSTQFAIVGNGPDEAELKNKARRLGLNPSRIFWGTRNDIPEFLKSLDIVVLPSVSESFSLVALEAMYAERPIVATTVGGIPEVVRDGETGFLVPPRSSLALAEAVCNLLADPEACRRLGSRGRQLVLTEYTPHVLVDRTLDAYQRAKHNMRRP
jgi:glycosyltransferase involved in cell wall biosynthesis